MAWQFLPADTSFFLVGNKVDRADEREITFSEGPDLSAKLGAGGYFETSAVTGVGCEHLIDVLSHALRNVVNHRCSQANSTETGEKHDCC
jgi:predicted GTPase